MNKHCTKAKVYIVAFMNMYYTEVFKTSLVKAAIEHAQAVLSGYMPKKQIPKKKKIEYPQEEIIDLICDFAKSGKTQSEIGMILRDQYGVPDVKEATGRSISQILKEKGLLNAWPEDLFSLFKKAVRVAKHLEKNKKDIHNRRNLRIIESKIKRLVRYYKSVGRIPDDWYYDIEKVKMIVKE